MPCSVRTKKLIISACLLGEPCRYDGKSKPCELAEPLKEKYDLIPVCPECMGGLSTPRAACEIVGERVLTEQGKDCTAEYTEGAKEVLRLCNENGCTAAVLKARSPSCGSGEIYDGSFTKTLTAGNGITAELLLKNGIAVFNENQIDGLL